MTETNPSNQIAFRIRLLSELASFMTPTDLETFRGLCDKATEDSLSEGDVEALRVLYSKFEYKPRNI